MYDPSSTHTCCLDENPDKVSHGVNKLRYLVDSPPERSDNKDAAKGTIQLKENSGHKSKLCEGVTIHP